MIKYVLPLILGLLVGSTELLINGSPSLPYRVFLLVKPLPVKKGVLVSIGGHRAAFVSETRFTKRLIGVAGDPIILEKHTLKSRTKDGHPLTPLKATVVPPGFVFVLGDHVDSFDSRYAEFGLVSVDHIRGRVIPLW